MIFLSKYTRDNVRFIYKCQHHITIMDEWLKINKKILNSILQKTIEKNYLKNFFHNFLTYDFSHTRMYVQTHYPHTHTRMCVGSYMYITII